MKTIYTNIDDVYRDAISNIYQNGKSVDSVSDNRSVGSFFGDKERPYKEIIGYNFILDNPRSRIITSRNREMSLGFAIANFLWVFGGKKDVESISFYNRLGKAFSNNGEYYESAFGGRIFSDFQSWEFAKELLTSDVNTRRALIPIFLPKDLIERPLDTPCASYIHLFIRDNCLDMVLSMRSQSVIMVFPYDLFLFTMLQEFFSLQLNIKLGKFYYYCDSFHYYLNEEKLGQKIIQEESVPNDKNSIMPEMTSLSSLQINNIQYTEDEIRKRILTGEKFPYDKIIDVDGYWSDLLYAIWAKGCQENNRENRLNQPYSNKYLDNHKI